MTVEILTEFWCAGSPRTKGSLDPCTMQDTPESSRWRAILASAARADYVRRHGPDAPPYPRATLVRAVAWLSPPIDWNADDGAIWARAGDGDKLARNLLDALSTEGGQRGRKCAGVYLDDNLVESIVIDKYVADERGPGMLVRVSPVDPDWRMIAKGSAEQARDAVMRARGLIA